MRRRMGRLRGSLALAAVGCALMLLVVDAGLAVAYERYNDGCQSCHGEFTDGTSPKGTIFPSDNKHTMHNDSAYMDADCNLCHSSGDGLNPFIGSSNGTDNNPGVGCTGCHGRDYGGAIGDSGVGLRAHHEANGVSCSMCHPGDPAPLAENVKPTYYGTPDTRADDPCNSPPDYLENWSTGDTKGLDNDGDNLYDENDDDCGGCAGDLDGDGDTDHSDLGELLAAWCTQEGDPNWNPNADVDGDGHVGHGDLGILLGDWGCVP